MNEIVRWPTRRRDVKLIDQYPIYELGAALQRLKWACSSGNAPALDQVQAFWTAGEELKKLLESGAVEIAFSRQSATLMLSYINNVMAGFYQSSKPLDQLEPVPTYELMHVRSQIDIFEHQFSAELAKLAVYAVPAQGIFSTERLVDNADLHIHESVRERVPSFARKEYRQAGRCLAFRLFSASGFHSARAVENVLRGYYEAFLGSPKKDDLGLGLMASHLNEMIEKKVAAKRLPKENTVRHLRDFARLDRNPLVHKAVELEEVDAVTLFNSALGVIVEMTKELVSLDQSPVTSAAEAPSPASVEPT